jgi:hypothetical protein
VLRLPRLHQLYLATPWGVTNFAMTSRKYLKNPAVFGYDAFISYSEGMLTKIGRSFLGTIGQLMTSLSHPRLLIPLRFLHFAHLPRFIEKLRENLTTASSINFREIPL